MSVLSFIVYSIVFFSFCDVNLGKKSLYSIRDCNQQTVGLVDCRYMGWQSIPYDVFDLPVGKSSIKLGGNPFKCDCRMSWFWREHHFTSWNREVMKDLFDTTLRCASPKKNKDARLVDLSDWNICDELLYPHTILCEEDKRRNLLNCDNLKTSDLPYNIFETKMKKISLQNFHYKCDCSIVWFLRKLKQRKYRNRFLNLSNIGRCVYPKKLRSKRPLDLTEEDVCPLLPKKEINPCKKRPCHFFYEHCKNEKYTFKCEDRDECKEKIDGCPSKTMNCVNKIPSFICVCKPGFYTEGNRYNCKDIDECKNKNRCGKNAKCVNLPGSYECKCNTGFVGKGTACFDFNECLKKGTCPKDAKCINTPGSFTCTCKSGFSGNGTDCKDIDECKDKNTCSPNADCLNSHGSYECRCKHGFNGNGKICTDVDECSTGLHTCHRDAKCINTSPGYQCECKSGYKSSKDGRLCEDLNECESITYCARHAKCENSPGSYQCICESGYSGDGRYCQDIDECKNNLCSPAAKCQNIEGSYICTCNNGYYGNGKVCKDIDECSERDACLFENSKCVNTPGSYQCKCLEGYSLNNEACSDIDECVESPQNCDANEVCINFVGGYKCECKEGYERLYENEQCFKVEEQPLFYERIEVQIGAFALVLIIVLLTIICCCCKCCGKKKKASGKPTNESEEPLLYGAELPYIPMDMTTVPPNISMISAYSEKDFDAYGIVE